MTYHDKVVLSACTGILLVDDYGDVHRYINELLGYPVFTHELANRELWDEIREKAKPDLFKVCGLDYPKGGN